MTLTRLEPSHPIQRQYILQTVLGDVPKDDPQIQEELSSLSASSGYHNNTIAQRNSHIGGIAHQTTY